MSKKSKKDKPNCTWNAVRFPIPGSDMIHGFVTSCGEVIPNRGWEDGLPKYCEACGRKVVFGEFYGE